jgi:predicted transposase YdaD
LTDIDSTNLEDELATHPHDAFFKLVFANTGHAAAFFRQHLSTEMSQKADWSSLRLVPATFIKRDLKQSQADLLFTLSIADNPHYIHLLFEHQTSVDHTMPLRILGYMHAIWTQTDQPAECKLTPILAVVLHQGPATWTVPETFHGMFPAAALSLPGVAESQPDFRYLVVDLTKIRPEHEYQEQSLKIVLHLMKLARQRDQIIEFFQWLDRHLELQISNELFRLCLLYALHADPDIDFKHIYETFHQRKELKNEAMNAVQKLKAEGHMQGRMEGQSQGAWIGRIQLLAELMKEEVPATEEMGALSIPDLKARYQILQKEYDRRHKAKP